MKCATCGKWLAVCRCPPMKVENEHVEPPPFHIRTDRKQDGRVGRLMHREVLSGPFSQEGEGS